MECMNWCNYDQLIEDARVVLNNLQVWLANHLRSVVAHRLAKEALTRKLLLVFMNVCSSSSLLTEDLLACFQKKKEKEKRNQKGNGSNMLGITLQVICKHIQRFTIEA